MGKFYRGKEGKSHPERRRFPRLKDRVKVRFAIPLEFSGVKWETKTKDIGVGGIRIQRDERIKKGTVVAMELELPVSEEDKEVIRAMARVVWCKKIGEEDGYSIGFEFVLHDRKVQEKICQFVDDRLGNK